MRRGALSASPLDGGIATGASYRQKGRMAQFRFVHALIAGSRCAIGAWLASAALLLSFAPLQAEPHEAGIAPEVEEFGDWSVACDNTGRCEAISASRQRALDLRGEWGEAAMIILRVVREAGPRSAPRVFVDRRVWGEGPSQPSTALTLHVLYPAEQDRTGRAYRLGPLQGGQHELDPRDVNAFLAESRKSSAAATRTAGEKVGDLHGLTSTSGLVAALRYMDEAQGRRDTVTAIFAKGELPASRVAVPKAPPVVDVVRGAAGQAARDAPAAELARYGQMICGIAFPPTSGLSYSLANGDVLWRIDCPVPSTEGGEHTPVTVWFVAKTEGGEVLAAFPRPEQGRPPLLGTLPNAAFDPASGLLTATQYYGSNRDCGWQRRWAWDGTAWQLVAGRELHGCMGVLEEGWLVTWQAVAQ